MNCTYSTWFRINENNSKEDLMLKMFGSRIQRRELDLESNSYFKTLYFIETWYDKNNIENYNSMFLYMKSISNTYKSCDGWSIGKFLNKTQEKKKKYINKKRFCPIISRDIQNIICSVKAFRIPLDIKENLESLEGDQLNTQMKNTNSIIGNYNLNNYYDDFNNHDEEFLDTESDSDDDFPEIAIELSIGPDYTTLEDIGIKLSLNEVCGICYEDLNIENISWWNPCGHVCCIDCQSKMKLSGRTIKCHMCRAKIVNNNIGKLMTIRD